MKNSMLWMMLACLGVAVLFFFLPLAGLAINISKVVYALALVACAASMWYMMRSSPKRE
jgi:membrane protein implicated in regulation of membrane protease activity